MDGYGYTELNKYSNIKFLNIFIIKYNKKKEQTKKHSYYYMLQ